MKIALELARRSLTPLVLLLAAACATVYSTGPVGSDVHVLDPEDWDGTWMMGNGGTCTLRVLDGTTGRLEAVVIGESDGRLETHVLQVTVREHDGWLFASFEEPTRPGLELWARIWREEEQIVAWLPHPEALAPLVQGGRLPGRLEEHGDVVLEPLDGAQLETLHAGLDQGLFVWDQPLAMVRIARLPH